MTEQVTIMKKSQLSTAGQAWVAYHMSHLRKHMEQIGMLTESEADVVAIPATPIEAESIYSPRIDDYVDDGEMTDDDPVPVKREKRKPAAKHKSLNQPKVRRYIQRG